MKLTNLKSTNHGCAAISLAELLVAAGLTGIVTASVFAGISTGLSTLDSTRQELRATQILQERLEGLRLYNWDQINTPGFVPTEFTASYNPTATTSGLHYQGTVTITNVPFSESYSANMRQVTVALVGTAAQVAHTR